MKTAFLSLIFCFILSVGQTQDRLKPGKIYNPGDEIFAPMVGYRGVVPDGWFGTLPQGEEYFLMIPTGNADGYIFINAHNLPLDMLAQQWKQDYQLTDKISISIKGEPKTEGNKMTAFFDVHGSEKPFMAYAEAVEGGHGWTVVMVLLSPVDLQDTYMNNFRQLVESSKIEEPSIGSLYAEFNWEDFVKDKYLMSYLSSGQYKEQNEIWFCPDGTFRSKIRSSGALKVQRKDYAGNKKGTWVAEGVGEKGKVHLKFTKDPELVIDMEIKDDKIFVNGSRFFALQNENCK
jgi:hypothetical protein